MHGPPFPTQPSSSWGLHGKGAQGDLVPPGVLANWCCRAHWELGEATVAGQEALPGGGMGAG